MFNATDRTACSRFALSQVAHLAVHSCRGTLRECVLLFHALVRLFACFRSHENTKACESPCESENRDTCGREQKSRQVAADEWVSLAGRTGLEPATSGVTGRRSNRLNYHPAWELGNRTFRTVIPEERAWERTGGGEASR